MFEPVMPGVGSLTGYCEDGLNAAGTAIENQLTSVVDESMELTLAGTAEADEIDAEYNVQTLINGVWEGAWTEGAVTGDVNGTFDGHRL